LLLVANNELKLAKCENHKKFDRAERE